MDKPEPTVPLSIHSHHSPHTAPPARGALRHGDEVAQAEQWHIELIGVALGVHHEPEGDDLMDGLRGLSVALAGCSTTRDDYVLIVLLFQQCSDARSGIEATSHPVSTRGSAKSRSRISLRHKSGMRTR